METSSTSEPLSSELISGAYKVIYAYGIPELETHRGKLKVGDATLHSTKAWDEITQAEPEGAARARIREQVATGRGAHR